MSTAINAQPDKLQIFNEELLKTPRMLENIFGENREIINRTNQRIDMAIESLHVKRNTAKNEHEMAQSALASAQSVQTSLAGAVNLAPLIERERKARERLMILEQACSEARNIKEDYNGLTAQYSQEEQNYFQDYNNFVKRTSSALEKYTELIRQSSRDIAENSIIAGRMGGIGSLISSERIISIASGIAQLLRGIRSSGSTSLISQLLMGLGTLGALTGTGITGGNTGGGLLGTGINLNTIPVPLAGRVVGYNGDWKIQEDGSRIWDTPEDTRKLNIEQGNADPNFKGTCGIVSVENVLAMAGIKKSERELIEYAKSRNPPLAEINSTPGNNGGTNYNQRRELLNAHGISSSIVPAPPEKPDINMLANAIEEGKGVIISVDAGRLWRNSESGGHAIVVTSVRRDSHGNILGFFVSDSGTSRNEPFKYYDAAHIARALTGRPMNVTDNKIR